MAAFLRRAPNVQLAMRHPTGQVCIARSTTHTYLQQARDDPPRITDENCSIPFLAFSSEISDRSMRLLAREGSSVGAAREAVGAGVADLATSLLDLVGDADELRSTQGQRVGRLRRTHAGVGAPGCTVVVRHREH